MVVLGALAVGALGLQIFQAALNDARFEIIQFHPQRNTLEELEGAAVQFNPGRHGLVKNELNILVARVRQGEHAGPSSAGLLGDGIIHPAGRAEVDLDFFARLDFDPHGGVGSLGFQFLHEAPNG